ncbi:MAG: hypothetical protein ACNS64_12600, partial [Candidatus Halalkalibacterium sp. M3_1C_030]
ELFCEKCGLGFLSLSLNSKLIFSGLTVVGHQSPAGSEKVAFAAIPNSPFLIDHVEAKRICTFSPAKGLPYHN